VEETLAHTRVQFDSITEDRFAHVDPEKLLALDGRKLDEGTPDADAGSFDAEDVPVLFELDRLRSAAAGAPPCAPEPYDCVVVDEAQEFAPLELALLGRALAPGGTLILAGDEDQQTDAGADFGGWAATLRALGVRRADRVELSRSHRCPPEVVRLAEGVLGQRPAPARPPRPRGVAAASFPRGIAQLAWLVEELRRAARGPRRSTAILCRTPATARTLARMLRPAVGARLALDGDLGARAGVHVACVTDAKGLEFDTVIVPDATPEDCPVDARSRRALYVALTRTVRRLVVSTPGRWTRLLEGRIRLD
jgi:superfamily I DNA/RNA helicase